jgi:hypothetical protein
MGTKRDQKNSPLTPGYFSQPIGLIYAFRRNYQSNWPNQVPYFVLWGMNKALGSNSLVSLYLY